MTSLPNCIEEPLGSNSAGWSAGLELEFYVAEQKTVARQVQHHGPLQTQRPFYPEGDDVCHTYILHPPGGVVGGDKLEIKVRMHEGAKALVTTPAAGKFYRSAGSKSLVSQKMIVGNNAVLEWLPQENIIYNKAKAAQTSNIELGENACFLGWEICCLGLAASNELFEEGLFNQTFNVWQDGVPLLLERSCFETDSAMLKAAWGLRNCSVVGTLICSRIPGDKTKSLLNEIRSAVAAVTEDDLFSVTTVSGMIVCRYLGYHAYKARKCFVVAWKILRKSVLGRSACLPRIWNT